jgi:peroxiredoxin Q/BCP
MTIEEGRNAPCFNLEDQDKNVVSLEDFKGKDLIIYFYPKDDTPGCIKEACGFRELWKEISNTGAIVLGVSPDDSSSHTSFIKKYDLPLNLLSDPDKSMMTEYEAYGEKIMYGKKLIGIIRSTVWIGPDGKVKKHWKKVPNAAKHPEKVLQLLLNQSQ